MKGKEWRRAAKVSRSRRQVLVGAGGMAVFLGTVSHAVLAEAATGGKGPLTAASFIGDIDRNFYVDDGSSPKPFLKLLKVVQMPRGRRPGGLRDPFSLIFANPDGVELEPQTYDVLHPTLGWMPMFLSPIGPKAARYEAAFN